MAVRKSKAERESEELQGVVNAAKTLLANIRFMSVDNPIRTIALTSSVPNEGKTFVASNLASAIATSGRTCLLVECDMRRRSMAQALGVHAQHGLYSVISGQVELTRAAVSTPTPNLYFLDAEPRIPNPSDLLGSHRFADFITTASDVYDYVVFDTPPVGTFVDAAVLGVQVDAVFMVVRENFAHRNEVVQAAEQLQKAGCNLAGVVMNYCESHGSEYYYSYYYGKGHHDEDAPELNLAGHGPVADNQPEQPAARPTTQQRAEHQASRGAAAQSVRTTQRSSRGAASRQRQQVAQNASSSATSGERQAAAASTSRAGAQQGAQRRISPNTTAQYEALAQQARRERGTVQTERRASGASVPVGNGAQFQVRTSTVDEEF